MPQKKCCFYKGAKNAQQGGLSRSSFMAMVRSVLNASDLISGCRSYQMCMSLHVILDSTFTFTLCSPFPRPASSLRAVLAAPGSVGSLGLRPGLSGVLLLHAGEKLQCAVRSQQHGRVAQRVSLRGLCHQPGEEPAQVPVGAGLRDPALAQVPLSGPQQHLLHHARSL